MTLERLSAIHKPLNYDFLCSVLQYTKRKNKKVKKWDQISVPVLFSCIKFKLKGEEKQREWQKESKNVPKYFRNL